MTSSCNCPIPCLQAFQHQTNLGFLYQTPNRPFLTSFKCCSHCKYSFWEKRGLVSRTAAGNKAYPLIPRAFPRIRGCFSSGPRGQGDPSLLRKRILIINLRVTNMDFLHIISTHDQDKRLQELIKWTPKEKCFELWSNSLNLLSREMYGDQFGEFLSNLKMRFLFVKVVLCIP